MVDVVPDKRSASRDPYRVIIGLLKVSCSHTPEEIRPGGLIKTMRDPQMWANKWLSQTLHILNTTAKGGIVAEEDAFADMTEAEEKWAQPDTIVWSAPGSLSGGNPKNHEEAGRRPHPKPSGPDAADRKPELTTGSSS